MRGRPRAASDRPAGQAGCPPRRGWQFRGARGGMSNSGQQARAAGADMRTRQSGGCIGEQHAVEHRKADRTGCQCGAASGGAATPRGVLPGRRGRLRSGWRLARRQVGLTCIAVTTAWCPVGGTPGRSYCESVYEWRLRVHRSETSGRPAVQAGEQLQVLLDFSQPQLEGSTVHRQSTQSPVPGKWWAGRSARAHRQLAVDVKAHARPSLRVFDKPWAAAHLKAPAALIL